MLRACSEEVFYVVTCEEPYPSSLRAPVSPHCLYTWLFICRFDFSKLPLTSLHMPPEGRPGMSDVSPLSGISGLSFDSTLLYPLLFFCLVLLLFLSGLFLPAGPFFRTFSRKFFSIFRYEISFFVWLLFSSLEK